MDEHTLPKLPLPSVQDTLQHVKRSLEPLYYADGYYKHPLDPQHVEQLQAIIADFQQSPVAVKLQDTLAQFARDHGSYLDPLQLDQGTSGNDILPRNPFLILADDALPQISQVDRSAVLVHSALRFISAHRKGLLPNDTASATSTTPLSMFGYSNLFGTTRKPVFSPHEIESFDLDKPFTVSDLEEQEEGTTSDDEGTSSDNENDGGITMASYPESRHIVIISRGQYYTIDVLDEDADIIGTIPDLARFINYILEDSHSTYNESTALGSLTAHSFKNWKYARKRLYKRYPQELHLLDSALFVLILDESEQFIKPNFNNVYTSNDNYYVPEFDQERSSNCKRLLYGTSIIDKRGYQVGSCVSRWFDKLQLVVTRDSKAAVIWDSFTCDGSIVLRFASEMYTESTLRLAREVNAHDPRFSLWPQVTQTGDPLYKDYPSLSPKQVVNKIEWSFSNILNTHVHLSETKLADLISKYDIVRVSIPMGRKQAQRIGITPDSMVQIALQLAHYTLYGQMISTLEPISTRNFQNSRSSFINIQDQQLLELCQLFISSNVDPLHKFNKFIQMCNHHHKSIKLTKGGHTFYNHFQSLKALFQNYKTFNLQLNDTDKIVASSLFKSPLIQPFNHPEMIAANCGNAATTTFGITPATANGFGIGYIIKDDQIDLTVTSQFRQGKRFMFMLNWVLQEIKSWNKLQRSANVNSNLNVNPLVDKLYQLDNARNKKKISTDNPHNDPFNYGFFNMDGNSRSISATPPIKETIDNNNVNKLTSKLSDLVVMNQRGSSLPLSVPTESEKLVTGHQIVKMEPASQQETPIVSDNESETDDDPLTRPESKRRNNVINSKFDIDFDRSNVGRKIIAFE